MPWLLPKSTSWGCHRFVPSWCRRVFAEPIPQADASDHSWSYFDAVHGHLTLDIDEILGKLDVVHLVFLFVLGMRPEVAGLVVSG